MKKFITKYPAIFIIIIVALLFIMFAPVIIEWLFSGNIGFVLTTLFEPSQILSYIGAILPLFATIIFSWLVIQQNERINEINSKLQKQNMRISENTLKYETFTYLIIDKVKVLSVEDNARKPPHSSNEIKSLPLTERIFPSEVYRKNTDFAYIESWGEKRSHIKLCEGKVVEENGNVGLVMYSIYEPFTTKGYTHCTPMQLVFYAKPSGKLSVSKMKVHKFELALVGQRCPYGFSANLKNVLDIKITPATHEVDDNSNHQFSVKLYLIHDDLNLIQEGRLKGINFNFEVTYINPFGVETSCQQVIWFTGDDFVDKSLAPSPFILSIDISANKNEVTP